MRRLSPAPPHFNSLPPRSPLPPVLSRRRPPQEVGCGATPGGNAPPQGELPWRSEPPWQACQRGGRTGIEVATGGGGTGEGEERRGEEGGGWRHCSESVVALLGVRGGLAGVRRVLFSSHSAGQAFARDQDLAV